MAGLMRVVLGIVGAEGMVGDDVDAGHATPKRNAEQ